MNRAEITEQLRQRGWTIEEGAPAPFELPTAVADRHPRLPSALIEFLSGLSTCANQDETAWFLCQRDYNGTSDSAFHWDEFEQMSIDSARDDQKTLTEIRCFWDAHLPFLLSVRGGYAFYAVRTTSDRFGEVSRATNQSSRRHP